MSTFQPHTPSSSPKRKLRPESPHRDGTSTVGKLNFLQSDNIDEHFEHIHDSHTEILNYLQLLDAYTQKTQMDLDQLFDRLKNNNQHLSTLLSSIAEYSREVTEEGSATKTDVSRILNVLNDLRDSPNLEELMKRLSAKQEEILKEWRSYTAKSTTDLGKSVSINQHNILNKLQSIETQLGGIKIQNTFGEFRSRVESLAQENSKEVNAKLTEVLQALQLLNLKDKSHNPEVSLNDLKQADLQKEYNDLSRNYSDLEKSYTDLESRYSKLESRYDAKIQRFLELQSDFLKLGEESKNLKSSMADLDASKYDKVHELHSRRVRDLRNVTPLQRHNRIASMPLQNHFLKETNNSDLEE
ncbi:hypothetical protein METBIDRAFT_47010 [Metschnikowia bicuspidata var. bicuspidata NRRL YB-4993]|uniref:Uncharacterized protein n=1 Tax=Metschnikowia bicuspidata var. bicuspidata NRRL YB-4993 TaxID=869754 RepID=A0A1A0H596_9ASCO|nr:hypothetical protein METBIDRAFT_47010 [Metschnikowia bicuspidata var. bicuspidata NRRL YB-4993]OBA19254.1 hypothetical protein METBIDRAFT_47010 [Metschnikowia bicuspidata var. bicuspidata NRRL YB-4993]